jgi:putative ABC transport system permease protein
MKVRDTFSFSFGAIRLRKMRSGLTTLGIVIGIAAIVALMSFTQGFQIAISNQFAEGFATDTVTITTQQVFPGFGGTTNGEDITLYYNDTEGIENLELVDSTTSVVGKQVALTSPNMEITTSVTGVDFDVYSSMFPTQFETEIGEIPTTPGEDPVVVIGQYIYDPYDNDTKLAEIDDEIILSITIRNGTDFQVKNLTVTVVGVLGEIGTSMGGPSDTGIYIPIDLAIEYFQTTEVNAILVKLVDDSESTIETATSQIEELYNGDISVISSTAILDTVSAALGTVETLLLGIAGISLLVAGVGIMNIMIVSLMERTREIGILKAVGAKGRSILAIFLSEALIIGILGGIFGIITGGVIVSLLSSSLFGGLVPPMPGSNQAMSAFTSITPVITPELILMALLFGMIVSVVFGLYPAWRASKLRPVDALRHE